MYKVTYKLKHSTYKKYSAGAGGGGVLFDAIIIIIHISINYGISMPYSFEIQHLSCNICQKTVNIEYNPKCDTIILILLRHC